MGPDSEGPPAREPLNPDGPISAQHADAVEVEVVPDRGQWAVELIVLFPDEDAPPSDMQHRGTLEWFGIAMVIMAALIFLGGAKADAGAAVVFAIVLFVVGLVTTVIGYRSVVER